MSETADEMLLDRNRENGVPKPDTRSDRDAVLDLAWPKVDTSDSVDDVDTVLFLLLKEKLPGTKSSTGSENPLP